MNQQELNQKLKVIEDKANSILKRDNVITVNQVQEIIIIAELHLPTNEDLLKGFK